MGDGTKTYKQPDAWEANNFGAKYDTQETNKKAECISNMGKELEGLEEGPSIH